MSTTDGPTPTPAPRVLVTRAAEDAHAFSALLAAHGYEPVEVPLLQRRWQVDAVAEAAARWGRLDWVLVTSATTADVLGVAVPAGFPGARWAAVGPGTAQRLSELGFPVDLVPSAATAAALRAALGDVSGRRIGYPRADLADPALADALRAGGAEVLEVVAYTNLPPDGAAERLNAALPVDATTLLSSSAARRTAEAVPPERRHLLGKVVVIGPSTLATAQRLGLPVHAVADPHTVPGVLAALGELLSR